MITFTNALKRCGGIAVKVESAGVAHEWDHWFDALNSENPFDLYRTFVVLIGWNDSEAPLAEAGLRTLRPLA